MKCLKESKTTELKVKQLQLLANPLMVFESKTTELKVLSQTAKLLDRLDNLESKTTELKAPLPLLISVYPAGGNLKQQN